MRVVLLLGVFVSGCGHVRTPADRVAVLPFDGVGVGEERLRAVRQVVTEQLVRTVPFRVVPARRVDQAFARAPSCRDASSEARLVCAAEVGERVRAGQVVAGALGGLGKTQLVQLKRVQVASRAVVRSLEETIFEGAVGVTPAAERLAERLFDERRVRPWYAQWWLWTIAGVATAAAVVVPLSVRSRDRYDTVPLP
ncbi:MAG: hypothetical protein IT371_09385 [Deltaproteobacteria bacterium]|nr:hypothetical protein [Deltaproteobacteria bacterium]